MSKYKTSRDHFEELVKFYDQNKRVPSYNATDPYEKQLYSWVQSMKMAKRGKGTANYPDWLDEKIKEYGILSWFLVLDKAKEQFISLIAFYQEHNRKPRRYNAINTNEKKLAHWVYYMRQQRANGDKYYPEWLDEEAEKYEILSWFLRQDIRQDRNQGESADARQNDKQENRGDPDQDRQFEE